uniref:Uncharacterized protein n=1 Tax=Lepeophtheirus salmonis TaxID=72036 RepID=A0A0K2U0Z6_LEPSM
MKFLFTSIFLLSLSSSAFSVKWIEAQNGEIPENAVKFKHSYTEYTNTVYCRAKDEESDNLHSGIMHEGEEACEYPIVSSNSVAYASEYEILSLDDSKDRIQFRFRLPGEPVPPGAVKCHDDEIEDCYFGRSMYSDGICEEELGKIDPSSELIYVAAYKEVHACPFFLYLTDSASVQKNGHHIYPHEHYNRFLQL